MVRALLTKRDTALAHWGKLSAYSSRTLFRKLNTMTSTEAHTIKSNLPFVHDLSRAELQRLQREAADHAGVDIAVNDALDTGISAGEMAVIPPGMFEMGGLSAEFGYTKEEGPQHYVGIQHAFAMGRYTVTAEAFALFEEDTGWKPIPGLIKAEGNYPVINVRLRDAIAYAKWLTMKTGQVYRLPTEAEWEYAARAGTLTPFVFGDSVSCKDVHFNAAFPYNELKQKKRWFVPRCVPLAKALPVGSKLPNAWGLHEVNGNVWELTSSPWTNSHANARRDGRDPELVSDWIVTKGGSWFDPAVKSRTAARMPRHRSELDVNLGFRLVRELA